MSSILMQRITTGCSSVTVRTPEVRSGSAGVLLHPAMASEIRQNAAGFFTVLKFR